VCVGRHGGGEVGEEAGHGSRRDPRQHEAERFAGSRPHRRENVGELEAAVAQHWRPLTPHQPAVAGSALLANVGLVLEPERDPFARMGNGGRRYGRAEPLFTKASAALGPRFG
jgi:hypothetical protein